MSFNIFKREVEIVSWLIRPGPKAVNNVVLEGTPAVIDRLKPAEWVYVKGFCAIELFACFQP